MKRVHSDKFHRTGNSALWIIRTVCLMAGYSEGMNLAWLTVLVF